MASKKPILKSVRLSGDVYALIEKGEGSNFSDKLENMVRICNVQIAEKKKKLCYLDHAISRRSDQCNRYWNFDDNLQDIFQCIVSCLQDVQKLQNRICALQEKFDQFEETAKQDIILTVGYITQAIDDTET